MKLGLCLVAVAALALAAGASAFDYLPYPDSEQPVWLSNDLIRFETNLATVAPTDEAYVVAPDGSGLRPATPDEAAAPAAAPPDGATFDPGTVDGDAAGGFAVSPDGRTAVFAKLVGWWYSSGYALYAVPTDGSSEPVRLTPDPCTLSSATHSALRGKCFDGTDGPDHTVGTRYGDLIITNSGDDVIRAGDGENVIESLWGNDDIRSGSGPDEVWAGDGNDTIRTGAGSDFIVPGPGHDTVDAGKGADHIWANDGQRDVIDCGPGDDTVVADRIDVLRNCEHVLSMRIGANPTIP